MKCFLFLLQGVQTLHKKYIINPLFTWIIQLFLILVTILIPASITKETSYCLHEWKIDFKSMTTAYG